jgi:uncharacterized iron-regulated protein
MMQYSGPRGKGQAGLASRAAMRAWGLWVLLLAAGCAVARWESPFGRDHPLVGRIWDVAAARFIDAGTLAERLARGRFVLLGEQHDNPDHHRLQAWVVRELVAAGRRPAVGFEMFAVDQADAIARHLARAPADAAGLADAADWGRSGWPEWRSYQPIAEAALEAGLPIVATNLSRADRHALMQRGAAGLDRGLVARLGLDRPLAADTFQAMADEIRENHCRQAPDRLIGRMVEVQRARDAQMAERLARAGGQDGAVLITGAGHARKDRGVPAHLGHQAPGASVVSLAFLEVRANGSTPAAYAARFERGAFPFDYVWFTPRVDDADPCEKFRQPLERLRQR